MTDSHLLFVVRAAHTVIYFVMAGSVFVVLLASIIGARDWWAWVALALVGVEVVIFTSSGMKCPMTKLAVRYGGNSVADTFLPEGITRHTLTFFGPLIMIGLILMMARWSGFLV